MEMESRHWLQLRMRKVLLETSRAISPLIQPNLNLQAAAIVPPFQEQDQNSPRLSRSAREGCGFGIQRDFGWIPSTLERVLKPSLYLDSLVPTGYTRIKHPYTACGVYCVTVPGSWLWTKDPGFSLPSAKQFKSLSLATHFPLHYGLISLMQEIERSVAR